MADSTKPARTPSEEALSAAKAIRLSDDTRQPVLGSWLVAVAHALDNFAAHRLSTALLNPSEEDIVALLREFEWDSSPADKEAARLTLRQVAAAVKITGRTD